GPAALVRAAPRAVRWAPGVLDRAGQRTRGGEPAGIGVGPGQRIPGDRDTAVHQPGRREPLGSEPAEAGPSSVLRDGWPRLIGAAYRIIGDLQGAEDVAAETLLTALDKWPLQGVPDRPGAWLMTVCRNRALNVLRDTGRAKRLMTEMCLTSAGQEPPYPDPDTIADDRLRLIALCCHPALSVDAQVALTLRMVGGLTTDEIARGFHLPVATVAQRIVRAKRALQDHRADFADQDPDIAGRLPAVLDVIYLIFNEGYLAAAGETLTRGDLAFEAYRLSCLLADLTPAQPEPWALRAL